MRGWPLSDLKLTIGDLELTPPDESQLDALASRDDVLAVGDERLGSWTQLRGENFALSTIQHYSDNIARWSPDCWTLNLVVTRGGPPLGAVSIATSDWSDERSVTTGSWLYQENRGMGIGSLARSASLSFAFDHLGAQSARSAATPDNSASRGVSKRLGYRKTGEDWEVTDAIPLGNGSMIPPSAKRVIRFEINREEFKPLEELRVLGFERARVMFGF